MTLIRETARVLRTHALGETSLIVVLFGRQQGLLRVVAKGARDPKSRLRGLLEPGTPLSLLVYLKPRGGLHLLKEAGLAGTLPRASADLESLALRMAALELTQRALQDEGPDPALYELLDGYLDLFDGKARPGFAAFFSFEAGLLDAQGLLPSLEECAQTGTPLKPGQVRFLPTEGAFVGPAAEGEGIDLAPGDWDCLVSLFQSGPAAHSGELMDPQRRRRIGRMMHRILSHHLPGYRLPKSLDLLRPSKDAGDKEPDA